MKCFIEDFRELDIDELLAVNGGYGSGSAGSYGKNSGGGGGGSGSYGSSSGSNSSSDTSWEVWVNNKDSRNKEGDITRYHDPNRDSPSNSGSYKGTSFVPEGNIGNNSGKKVLDFESVLEDLLNDQAQDTGDEPAVNSEDNSILTSIEENSDKLYNENDNGYCCDNWVEEVLSDAGYDPSEYMAGSANESTVQDHINNLEEGSYSTDVPTEEGSYVVYMNNSESSDYDYIPHAGILTVDNNGNMTFYHNSSSNESGGVGSEVVTSYDGRTLDGYGYDSFYFQEIN